MCCRGLDNRRGGNEKRREKTNLKGKKKDVGLWFCLREWPRQLHSVSRLTIRAGLLVFWFLFFFIFVYSWMCGIHRKMEPTKPYKPVTYTRGNAEFGGTGGKTCLADPWESPENVS